MGRKVTLIAVGNDYPRRTLGLIPLPPLGILAVGSFLSVHDVPVELLDVQVDFGFGLTAEIEDKICKRLARYVASQANEIAWVGVSQLSNTASGLELGREIRAALPETPIILGGYFPTSNCCQLLQEQPWITAIVRGDGEIAALEISRCLAEDRSFLCDSTPGLAWLEQGEVHQNPTRQMPLDDLPILDYQLLRNPLCYQVAGMMTSRGCPFRCNYCLEEHMRDYAEYPIEWIDRQLANIKSAAPSRHVFVCDPIFGMRDKRTLALCQVMARHGFSYWMESRVDVLSPDLLPQLRQAGVEAIMWGIESASPETLIRMNKVGTKAQARRYVDQALQVLEACFENDIMPFIAFMFGFPGDTEADCQAMPEFMRQVRQRYDRTRSATGFVAWAWETRVYEGSALAACIEEVFPETVLQAEPVVGESLVLKPSQGLDREPSLGYYRKEIMELAVSNARTTKMIRHYGGFSAEEFTKKHPDHTDAEGVTVLCKNLRRFPGC